MGSTGVKCVKCGAKLFECVVCKAPFYQRRKDHIYCRVRCRVRKARAEAKKQLGGAEV